MYQNCCKKCGSISLHTEVKGNNTGLYCDDCGAWVKWLGKDELRAFEHAKQTEKTMDLKIIKQTLNLVNYVVLSHWIKMRFILVIWLEKLLMILKV